MSDPSWAGKLAAGPFLTYPPGARNIYIPVCSRAGGRAALTLSSPCRRSAVIGEALVWLVVSCLGVRAVPGDKSSWEPIGGAELWETLCEAWRTLGRFDAVAVHERRQASRAGAALLLLRSGTPVAFVKVRAAPSSLAREREALTSLSGVPLHSFSVSTPLAASRVGSWEWSALAPLPPQRHRPAIVRDVTPLVEELQSALSVLPRPAGVPPGWVPMHGDLAPWNLRRFGRRQLYLVDWEDVSWGPSNADCVYYAATVAALGAVRQVRARRDAEAVAFWRDRIGNRSVGDFDEVFDVRLLRALDQLRP